MTDKSKTTRLEDIRLGSAQSRFGLGGIGFTGPTTDVEFLLQAIDEMTNRAAKAEWNVAHMKRVVRDLVDEWGDDIDDPFWNAARDALKHV